MRLFSHLKGEGDAPFLSKKGANYALKGCKLCAKRVQTMRKRVQTMHRANAVNRPRRLLEGVKILPILYDT